MTQNLTGKLNQLGLLLINLMLLVAFYFQFAQHELPCPLCLLQRVALCAIAVALAANVLLGDKPGHYGMMLLAAAAGFAVAGRQVLLHISPGDAGFGPPVLGLHFYTWAAIAFFAVFIGSGLLLMLCQREHSFDRQPPAQLSRLARAGVALTMLLLLGNALSVFLECGLAACGESPINYLLLN
ncbi:MULTISPECIES: disulfide bond formation protein B [Chromobacterium]|uniref:disulfide bond formation protein B n=1 Tax=Chromobacterium TaxID=535 RepID=UPI00188795EA|nr:MULTISPECIES: disulfide bond formation protein B [Chromobacterium]QOZ83985.1 disulfide bond formation protein B [Chromobacterium sp. Rain0013]WON84132.1 disulfide bond formation protein B [Chromobacterium haemolyticum]